MDWIERIFGISPDGGSGATEMLYLAALAFVLAISIGRRRLIALYRDLKAKR